MKYRLKKELPFAPVGSIIESDSVGLFVRCESKNFLTWYIEEKYELQNLINNGWIEEVKPREYKLGLNKDGTFAFIWDSEGNGYDAQRKYPVAETILVREVIE